MTSTEPNQASSKKRNRGRVVLPADRRRCPLHRGMTFIGEQSILERMRWEISEDRLTAYRSYERVQDSEAPVTSRVRPIRVPQLRRSRSSPTSMSSGFTTKPR